MLALEVGRNFRYASVYYVPAQTEEQCFISRVYDIAERSLEISGAALALQNRVLKKLHGTCRVEKVKVFAGGTAASVITLATVGPRLAITVAAISIARLYCIGKEQSEEEEFIKTYIRANPETSEVEVGHAVKKFKKEIAEYNKCCDLPEEN